jgi:hypothetical protein
MLKAMSNFTCEHCGAVCLDSPAGYYTGCQHYPAEIAVQPCRQCQQPIVTDDDDARLCIQCGGRNRRVAHD